jgi:hypothetical protein
MRSLYFILFSLCLTTTLHAQIDNPPLWQTKVVIGAVSANTVTLNFVDPDGDGRVLIARATNPVNAEPADGVPYSDGGSVFGSGSDLGNGNFVVYAGSGGSVTVTGLTTGTLYYFSVFEYNNNGGTPTEENYYTPGHTTHALTGAPTYIWSAGNGGGTWADPNNWSPTRTSPSPNDVMIFNYSTGPVTNFTTQTIGKLIIANGDVVFDQSTSTTLTIAGLQGPDFEVGNGSLQVEGISALTIFLAPGATGQVNSYMKMMEGGHKLRAADPGGITVNGVFEAGTGLIGNVFGITGPNHTVVFPAGSKYIHDGGFTPFGGPPPTSIVQFQPGSIYEVRSAPNQVHFDGRTYGNIIIDMPDLATINANGTTSLTMGTLSVWRGHMNIGIPDVHVKGNVYVEWLTASLNLNASPGTFTFDGTVNQDISGEENNITVGTGQTIAINNSAGVTLITPIDVSGHVNLINGVINTFSTGQILKLLPTGTISNGSNASYINGPLIRETTAAASFLFPVGKGGSYRPLSITPATTAASSYRAEYFNTGYSNFTICNSNLDAVATDEYWDATRNSGADASITLQYDAANTWSNSIAPDATKAIKVAHYTGTCWEDESQTVLPGNSTGGSITSRSLSTFSPFTIGYGPIAALPVHLTSIKAKRQSNGIEISWSNLTETDVLNYVIEHSVNGRHFTAIQFVQARLNNGSRADYNYLHINAPAGINYYRIKAIEGNGSPSYSAIVKVKPNEGNISITVYPNPIKDNKLSFEASSLPKGQYTIRVISVSGQPVTTQLWKHAGGTITESINLPSGLAKGLYMFQVSGNEQQLVKSFIIQ